VQQIYKLSRRNFLQTAMAAAGAAVACTGNRTKTGTPWRFLSLDEARILASVCDRIIPPDQDPGAAWAGVVNYIDRQLCGPLKRLRVTYRQGVAGVEQSSYALYGAGFADLDPQKQDNLLHLLEYGRAPGEVWARISSKDFFSLVLDHTLQGFYGDPRHGGNRDAASWKMLGLAYPPVRGRLGYDLTKL